MKWYEIPPSTSRPSNDWTWFNRNLRVKIRISNAFQPFHFQPSCRYGSPGTGAQCRWASGNGRTSVFFSAPSRFHWVNPPSRVPSLNQFLNSSGKEKELLIFKHSWHSRSCNLFPIAGISHTPLPPPLPLLRPGPSCPRLSWRTFLVTSSFPVNHN